MGLDAVILVMEIEEHFGITIKEAEAQEIRTVGDVVDVIRNRIDHAQLGGCETLPAFLRLRETVREVCQDKSLKLRPSERVVDRLTPRQRRRLWKKLPQLLGRPPESLRRTHWVRHLFTALGFVSVFMALAVAMAIDIATFPALLFLLVGLACITHWLTVWACHTPPRNWQTFGELAQRMVGTVQVTRPIRGRANEEILEELRPIFVDVLGVDASEVQLEARLVEDLSMD